jgi:pyruvate dehydrogenase phosphatase
VDKAWNWNWKRWAVSPSARIQPLESRFPAKTVVAVLLVGGLLYWVNVKFVIVNGFEPELYRQYNPSDAYGPLQHLPTPEAVEHHLQHVVEMTTPTTYTGYYSRLEGDQELQETACGWRMTEVDAQRWCMPLTHGCRAASNTPCVSVCPGSLALTYGQLLAPVCNCRQ